MDPAYWIKRWQEGQTGFHQTEVHPALTKYGDRLGEAGRVLVPLCGKSNDMTWLSRAGHSVVGIEVAGEAVHAYFEGRGMTAMRSTESGLDRWDGGGVSIWQADFFAVTPELLGPITAAYDRAALIAMSPETQERYAAHLVTLVGPGNPILMVGLEYDQSQAPGPPFAITDVDVRRLFGATCDVEVLERQDVLEESPRHKARGITSLHEQIMLVRPRGLSTVYFRLPHSVISTPRAAGAFGRGLSAVGGVAGVGRAGATLGASGGDDDTDGTATAAAGDDAEGDATGEGADGTATGDDGSGARPSTTGADGARETNATAAPTINTAPMASGTTIERFRGAAATTASDAGCVAHSPRVAVTVSESLATSGAGEASRSSLRARVSAATRAVSPARARASGPPKGASNAASSVADASRFDGSFSRQRATTAASAGAMSGTRDARGAGSSASTLAR
jgi:thiopurine S-methyltransferase